MTFYQLFSRVQGWDNPAGDDTRAGRVKPLQAVYTRLGDYHTAGRLAGARTKKANTAYKAQKGRFKTV